MIRFFLAAGVSIATLWLFIIFGTSSVGILLLLAGFTGSYYLYRTGKHFLKRAGDAQRGAKAEAEVADLLDILERRRWEIEYNLKLKRGGDADIVIHSPKGNWYVVDVKSHGGTKIYEKGRLRKRYGRNIYDFKEGDLIYKVKGQARQVRRLKGVGRVIAMLCFSQGDVDISGNQVRDVYVVGAGDLVDTLLQLDKLI